MTFTEIIHEENGPIGTNHAKSSGENAWVGAGNRCAFVSIKAAFNARHGGVNGLSRVTHDLLLRQYLDADEHDECASSDEPCKPDFSKFRH